MHFWHNVAKMDNTSQIAKNSVIDNGTEHKSLYPTNRKLGNREGITKDDKYSLVLL